MRFYSPRVILLSMLGLILVLSLSFFLTKKGTHQVGSKLKSAEEYWAETGLGASALEDLIQDNTCYSSDKYYQACANAVLSVANRYNLTLSQKGEIESVTSAPLMDRSSEKNQLQIWKARTQPPISFLRAWKQLENKYIIDKQKSFMVGVGLNGFISVFRDPHTYLVPVSLFKEVIAKADNQTSSLGIVIGKNKDQYIVRKVIEGSIAKNKGLQRGDILYKVSGQKVTGLVQAKLNELLKGEIGTTTELQILRQNEKLNFSLLRTEVTVPTVTTRFIDGIRTVGVIGINKFARGTCKKTKEALITLNKAAVRGLLLDLRDNPGGQMEEAACVAGLFVGADKKIFELKYLDSRKKSEIFYGIERKIFNRAMAVLVNGGSASASEIVAGALQDYGRAVLVGERTFGKGSFQEGEYWTQNKKIALFETKGFYYLPSGVSPQLKGLKPDVVVNFDNIFLSREEDQYMNPLRAPAGNSAQSRNLISMRDCLSYDAQSGTDDVQVEKARQVVFCSKPIAGVSQ